MNTNYEISEWIERLAAFLFPLLTGCLTNTVMHLYRSGIQEKTLKNTTKTTKKIILPDKYRTNPGQLSFLSSEKSESCHSRCTREHGKGYNLEELPMK
jgi:hypothetical protein